MKVNSVVNWWVGRSRRFLRTDGRRSVARREDRPGARGPHSNERTRLAGFNRAFDRPTWPARAGCADGDDAGREGLPGLGSELPRARSSAEIQLLGALSDASSALLGSGPNAMPKCNREISSLARSLARLQILPPTEFWLASLSGRSTGWKLFTHWNLPNLGYFLGIGGRPQLS